MEFRSIISFLRNTLDFQLEGLLDGKASSHYQIELEGYESYSKDVFDVCTYSVIYRFNIEEK